MMQRHYPYVGQCSSNDCAILELGLSKNTGDRANGQEGKYVCFTYCVAHADELCWCYRRPMTWRVVVDIRYLVNPTLPLKPTESSPASFSRREVEVARLMLEQMMLFDRASEAWSMENIVEGLKGETRLSTIHDWA
ncbi:hypothetical protein G7046_g9367 [Stylonectria norvegica]|nr:hypothetical protein G7046_g9367 [Stylonectria norvegica]